RIRRYVTPADINGSGGVFQWNPGQRGVNRGSDFWGRVEFNSYFRPPGLPGSINFTTVPPPAGSAPIGAIAFGNWHLSTGAVTNWTVGTKYATNPAYNPPPPTLPGLLQGAWDVTNNPTHGFESYRFPNQAYAGPFTPQGVGGVPIDVPGTNGVPDA